MSVAVYRAGPIAVVHNPPKEFWIVKLPQHAWDVLWIAANDPRNTCRAGMPAVSGGAPVPQQRVLAGSRTCNRLLAPALGAPLFSGTKPAVARCVVYPDEGPLPEVYGLKHLKIRRYRLPSKFHKAYSAWCSHCGLGSPLALLAAGVLE